LEAEKKKEDANPYGTGQVKGGGGPPPPPAPVPAPAAKTKARSSGQGGASGSVTASAADSGGDGSNATSSEEASSSSNGTAASSSSSAGTGSGSADDGATGAQDDDPHDAGVSHFTQWDVTNGTDFDGMMLNHSSSRHGLLPPWLPPDNADEPPHWDVAMLTVFAGLAVLLCAGTVYRRCRADRRRQQAGYEPVHSLVV
jgi:hypothetical protein